MAYLDDHPPARRQFYCPRRDGTQPSGVVVVHDAENATDTVGPDSGAEAVARFIETRDTPGSYHDLVDSDSIIQLVRYECEAFHDATGTNRHSYGVSGAYRHSDWLTLPQARRDGFVLNMASAAARYARWLRDRRGIVIPPKRISVTAARNRVPGFISHAELDPARRTDPGPHFPWDQFLAHFARLTNQEDDMTPDECEAVVRKVVLDADKDGGVRRELRRLGQYLALGSHNPAFPPETFAPGTTNPELLAAIQAVTAGDPVQIAQMIATALGPELAKGVADELHARLAA
jgi:hypothetical protein